MKALTTVRWRRTDWQVCPWSSVRAAVISLVVVVAVAVVFDRWVLARLERQGLVASDGWRQHNRVVITNHERKDRKHSFPRPIWASPAGVLAWAGHPVTLARSKPHRILVMGDSFVWGAPYLTLNHMWWRQLAIELQHRGYQEVEVIAAGVSGMSTRDELDLARYAVPEFRPDLILWGFVTNDPDERVVKQIDSSQLAPPIPGRVQKVIRNFTPRLLDLFTTRRSDKLAKCYLGPKYGYDYSEWILRIHEGQNFEMYRKTVLAVRAFLDEIQTPGLMVTLPEAPIAERLAFSYDKVLPLWRDAGIPVQDNLPALIERFPAVQTTGPQAISWGINPADSHPGSRSTAMIAQLTADRLERDYPQFLGPKSLPPDEIQLNDWLPYNLNLKPLLGQGKFELTYPATDEFLPTMPLEIPTILVALEQPQPLSLIRLQGSGLKSAQVWLSNYDSVDSYDTQEWKDLGLAEGKNPSWTVPADRSTLRASVIMIHASFETADRRLILELRKNLDESLPIEGRLPQ